MAHEADPRSRRPRSSHRRDRHESPPRGGPSLLFEPPGTAPRDLTPHRAQVTIRYPDPPPRRDWAGWWRRHWADLAAWTLIAVSLAALWRTHYR